ncbi:MAG TPA: NADP-dependent phosphogluconate dehydrogenase [Aestuariivirga sp.]|nr:NADP-dependent phosphogluconate dehydrogenase [Aestuariivirga sp.]
MVQAEIGMVGLGVMGANLALNIAEKGFTVAGNDRAPEAGINLQRNAGELASRIVPCNTLAALVAPIRPPRPIILLVPAGEAVDHLIAALRQLLSPGDIIIDSGNANFHDTKRRFAELGGTGLNFIGMGISGGADGARHGPSMMVGGSEAAYDRVKTVLNAIAAKYKGEPCCARLGNDGAGHFVKTIHNGIEYADMQMIAEIYGMLRDGLGLGAKQIGEIFARWNTGRLNSYLIEITASVLATDDIKTGRPLVDVILDRAGQKGTGRWAAIEAQNLGIPATAIEAAVAVRSLSAMKDERQRAAAAYGISGVRLSPADSTAFIDQLEFALYGGKIAAYAQGFAVMEQASAEFNWNLPLATIARIWRAGCIIRSQFLDEIALAFTGSGGKGNLLLAPPFVAMMKDVHSSLRLVVAEAARAASPLPALSSALNYFDGYRQAWGSANLIQAERDFFGAHGFERVDEQGVHHGPWNRPL